MIPTTKVVISIKLVEAVVREGQSDFWVIKDTEDKQYTVWSKTIARTLMDSISMYAVECDVSVKDGFTNIRGAVRSDKLETVHGNVPIPQAVPLAVPPNVAPGAVPLPSTMDTVPRLDNVKLMNVLQSLAAHQSTIIGAYHELGGQ